MKIQADIRTESESRFIESPGDYLLEIRSAEAHVSEKGNDCEQINFFSVRSAQGGETGRLFTAYFSKSKQALPHFKKFIRACGKSESAVDDPEELVGARVCATLIMKEWQGQERLSAGAFFKDRSRVNAIASGAADHNDAGAPAPVASIIRIAAFKNVQPRLGFENLSFHCTVAQVAQKTRTKSSSLFVILKIAWGEYARRDIVIEFPCDSSMSFEFFTALSVPTANNINITSDKLVGRELMVDVERKNTNMIYDKVLGFRAIAAQCNTTPRDDDPSHSLPDKTSEPQAYPLTG